MSAVSLVSDVQTPSFHPGKPNCGVIDIKVAHGFDEMQHAFAIRAAVYLAEQSRPYAQEFDGNDATATHIIGYVDGEPAATIRIRYFANFVKLERMAVRREYRTSKIGQEIVNYAVEFCRQKGFTALHGCAQEGRERYWQFSMRRYGKTEPIPGFKNLEFGGHSFTPMSLTLSVPEDHLKINTHPMVLNRPEGVWDRPGILETGVGTLPEPARKLRQ